MRISDWSSDVCSSDLRHRAEVGHQASGHRGGYRHRCGRPVRIQPEQVRTGGGCPDRAEDARGMKALRVVLVAVAGRQLGPDLIAGDVGREDILRSEEHTSELQSLMRISYAVFCLKKKNTNKTITNDDKKATCNITNNSTYKYII